MIIIGHSVRQVGGTWCSIDLWACSWRIGVYAHIIGIICNNNCIYIYIFLTQRTRENTNKELDIILLIIMPNPVQTYCQLSVIPICLGRRRRRHIVKIYSGNRQILKNRLSEFSSCGWASFDRPVSLCD